MRIYLCADCGYRLRSEGAVCVACWVRRSCEAQGVPTKVTDPDVLARVAVLLT